MVVSMTGTFEPDQIFSALADATRRDIVLRALSGTEGVAELAGHYPMSFAAVQKHVAVLERAGYEALWRGRIDRMTDLISRSKEIV